MAGQTWYIPCPATKLRPTWGASSINIITFTVRTSKTHYSSAVDKIFKCSCSFHGSSYTPDDEWLIQPLDAFNCLNLQLVGIYIFVYHILDLWTLTAEPLISGIYSVIHIRILWIYICEYIHSDASLLRSSINAISAPACGNAIHLCTFLINAKFCNGSKEYKTKRVQGADDITLDKALFEWLTQSRHEGIPLSGEILKVKAQQMSNR